MQAYIRLLTAEDTTAIKEIEVECGLSPWPTGDYARETERAGSFFVGAEMPQGIVGFAVARKSGAIVEILNIAVLSAVRRQGIGALLLTQVERLAVNDDSEALELEVRAGNLEARAFYERHGFVEQGRRNGFYSNPTDDAILMHKPIPKGLVT